MLNKYLLITVIILLLIVVYFIYRYVYKYENVEKYDIDKTLTPKYIIKLYYAEWCGHCNNFRPIWEKLKEKYNTQIRFEEMNCTNSKPDLSIIDGYPTIIVLNQNGDFYKKYTGNRDMNTLDEFINKLL